MGRTFWEFSYPSNTRLFVLKTQVRKFALLDGMTVEDQIFKQKDYAWWKQLLKSYERIYVLLIQCTQWHMTSKIHHHPLMGIFHPNASIQVRTNLNRDLPWGLNYFFFFLFWILLHFLRNKLINVCCIYFFHFIVRSLA